MNKRNLFSEKLFYLVLFLIIFISLLHYTTTTQKFYLHDIYRRAYYLPIVLAALGFGLFGGLSSSILITLIYTPHVYMRWQHEQVVYVDRIIDIILFNILGIIIGIYIDNEKKKKGKMKKMAEDLQNAYDILNRQTEKTLQLEEKLHLNERLSILGELSASIIHEIRNPLGSLKGVAEILMKRFGSDEVGSEFTGILEKEIKRLDSVMNNYLSLLKKSKAEKIKIALEEIINPVIELTKPRARKQNTKMSVTLNDAGYFVYADASQIQQVLLNVILNSLHAVQSGGMVSLKTYFQDNTIKIEIADTGKGIPKEDLKKLFDPFFTTKKEGIGLGLTISKRLIEEHNGTIRCNSELGKGSTFTILLPVYKET